MVSRCRLKEALWDIPCKIWVTRRPYVHDLVKRLKAIGGILERRCVSDNFENERMSETYNSMKLFYKVIDKAGEV